LTDDAGLTEYPLWIAGDVRRLTSQGGCLVKRSRWLQVVVASALVAGSLLFGASASFAAGSLSFVAPGPQDAGVGVAITTSDLNTPAGGPVQVAITGGSQSATVTVAIDVANSPDPEPGAVLGGTTSVRARSGVATFSNLTISKHGTYALVATANSMSSAGSGSFRIWDAVCSNGNSCNAGKIDKNSTDPNVDQESVGTGAPTGQTVALSLGDDSIDCSAVEQAHGVVANTAPLTVTLIGGGSNEKLVTLLVSRFWDITFGNPPGASHYEVCYVDDLAPWIDEFGATIQPGVPSLLPVCAPSQGAPCIESRNKQASSRNVKIVARVRDFKMH